MSATCGRRKSYSLMGDTSRAASILGWTSKVMTPRTSADHGRGGLCAVCNLPCLAAGTGDASRLIRWMVQGEASRKEQT